MKALILAAGQGKRLEPLTETQPKVMLPLVDKPLLEHLLIEVKMAGIREVSILVGYCGDDIKSYFGNGSAIGLEITYIEQKKLLGTAHAIAKSNFTEDFLVLNGDTLVLSSDIKKVMKAHSDNTTIAVKTSKNPEFYGVVEVDKNIVKNLQEKPEKPESNLISTGIYAFSTEIYSAIEKTGLSKRGEYEITDSIKIQMEDADVTAVEIENFFDIGSPWGYLDANAELLDKADGKITGKVEENVTINGKLILEEGAVIKSGSYIEGPVYIGEGSSVGPNTYLRSFATVGKRCRIGMSTEIKNTIIMDKSNVPHLSYLGDSIVGRDCNFGAGAKIGNLRLDNSNVKVYIKGKLVDTGRRKFGAIIGDNVKLGLNVMINSGRKIGSYSKIGPGVIIYRDIPRESTVIAEQKI